MIKPSEEPCDRCNGGAIRCKGGEAAIDLPCGCSGPCPDCDGTGKAAYCDECFDETPIRDLVETPDLVNAPVAMCPACAKKETVARALRECGTCYEDSALEGSETVCRYCTGYAQAYADNEGASVEIKTEAFQLAQWTVELFRERAPDGVVMSIDDREAKYCAERLLKAVTP